jgi:hypothetical protein
MGAGWSPSSGRPIAGPVGRHGIEEIAETRSFRPGEIYNVARLVSIESGSAGRG